MLGIIPDLFSKMYGWPIQNFVLFFGSNVLNDKINIFQLDPPPTSNCINWTLSYFYLPDADVEDDDGEVEDNTKRSNDDEVDCADFVHL